MSAGYSKYLEVSEHYSRYLIKKNVGQVRNIPTLMMMENVMVVIVINFYSKK